MPAARRFLEERAPTVAGDEEAIRWYGSYLVRGASPGAAAQITRMNLEIDIRHVLPTIQAPSLVLYRAEEYLRDATRYMGEHMPGARVERAARARTTCRGRATRRTCCARSRRILATVEAEAEPDRVLATVLHARVPDDAACRCCGGMSAGSGGPRSRRPPVLCARRSTAPRGRSAARRRSSPTPTRWASRRRPGCTPASARSTATSSPACRSQLADGVASVATAGEVLVSSTVRDLVAGSGMEFTERGTVRLPVRDAPPEWRLYGAVTGAITGRLPVA